MRKSWSILVIITIIIIVIIGITLVLIKNNNNNKSYDDNSMSIADTIGEINYGETKKIEKVSSRIDFYIIENCIKKFFKYIQDGEFEKASNCIDSEYLEKKEITKNAMKDQFKAYNVGQFIAQEIYEYDDTKTVTQYFVYGLLNGKEYYITVKADYVNETFSLLPNFYIDKDYMNSNNGIKIIEMK